MYIRDPSYKIDAIQKFFVQNYYDVQKSLRLKDTLFATRLDIYPNFFNNKQQKKLFSKLLVFRIQNFKYSF